MPPGTVGPTLASVGVGGGVGFPGGGVGAGGGVTDNLSHIAANIGVAVPTGGAVPLTFNDQLFDVSPFGKNSLAYWRGLKGQDINGNPYNPPPFNGFPP